MVWFSYALLVFIGLGLPATYFHFKDPTNDQ